MQLIGYGSEPGAGAGVSALDATFTTPSEREIRVVREFDAPRRLVWDAFTKPALLKQRLFGTARWALEVRERGE